MFVNSIKRCLIKFDYGRNKHNGIFLIPTRKELDLLNSNGVETWFIENRTKIIITEASKVGEIKANNSMPTDFYLKI